MKNKFNLILVIVLSLVFYSCETGEQNTFSSYDPNASDADGGIGYNPGDGTIGTVEELHFDFKSSEDYNKEYWKFDLLDFQATNLEFSHCGPDCSGEQDILTLLTFHNSYYVPPEAFDENASGIVYIENELYDPENPDANPEYVPFNSDNVNCDDPDIDCFNDLSDLLSETIEETTPSVIEEDFILSTPNLTSLNLTFSMIWSPYEGMYDFTSFDQIRDEIDFSYEYDYQINESFAPLDTIKNPRILDHMYIIDPTVRSDSIRYYVVLDSLQIPDDVCISFLSENTCEEINDICSWEQDDACVQIVDKLPVEIDRSYDFYGYINEINSDFGYRETTDCNDNYQQDLPELTFDDFNGSCVGIFEQNDNNLCNSICNVGGSNQSMQEWCWNEFLNIERLTGQCTMENGIAFCDTGNGLFDEGEYLYDQNNDNEISEISGTQMMEPFEDRNCNNSWDGEAEETIVGVGSQEDCNQEFSAWDSYHNKCFYDRGNGQWDGPEICKDSDYLCENEGDSCDCIYTDLYQRGPAPSYLIVDYADEMNGPTPTTTIFPADAFLDCGVDNICDRDEFGFNPGTCLADDYSGTEEMCCKNHFCWNYVTSQCDLTLDDCEFSDPVIWTENLDPAGDNCTDCNIDNPGPAGGSQTEHNFQRDDDEDLSHDFNDNNNVYSNATTYLTKFLPYSECSSYDPYAGNEPEKSMNCGGNTIEIISDQFKKKTASYSTSKYELEVYVESYDIIAQLPKPLAWLTNLNIVKTQWPSVDASDGNSEDYMLFIDNDGDSLVKLIQPYYYFANTPGGIGTDYIDYSQNDWWQSFEWEEDVLVEGYNIIDGYTSDNTYTITSPVATYEITKEYEVSMDDARMTYSATVEDCILITRVVTSVMIGPATHFKVRSQTYLKNDFDFDNDGTNDDIRLVKEVISWVWNPPLGANTDCQQGEYLGCGINWTKISSIEYKGEGISTFSSNGNANPLDLQNLENFPEFDGELFQISNTMGMQRVIAPSMFEE